ncbi:MAG: FAD-dependent oxidoreductase [Bauldia sp.]|nr:FAD-dependent oxidoreductase [Bauldia sp.]
MSQHRDAANRIAIIGGGVVGCAVFRAFALAGLNPVLLERGDDILSGASKGNSALLHTLYEATGPSLELDCVRAGYKEYLDIHERLNLPLLKTSALVVAWTAEELARLDEVIATAHRADVPDVVPVSAAELRVREPNLAHKALGAALVPREYVIDPWSAPLAYALQGIANGGEIRRACAVLSGTRESGSWLLETSQGPVRTDVVINCAGLNGDLVEAICRPSPFTIKPRKGQFIVYDKSAAGLVKAIILPLANKYSKGILIGPTAFGNLILGPTAEEQDDRERAPLSSEVIRRMIAQGEEKLPGLAEHDITAAFAGLRPATEFSDYQIEALPGENWITVGGIRSSGLSGALGIAGYVTGLYADHFGALRPVENPAWVSVPNICEYRPRSYQMPDCGEIVCHCERVTRREIEAALSGPLPALDIHGLKRRTRCMMGRCQGFYCSNRISELTRERFVKPLASGEAA